MENKLQQLTEKLYNEGLSKGRAEAEAIRAKAHADAERIVAEAQDKARAIAAQAEKSAEQLKTNTENEVKLEDAYRALWNIAVAALPQAADWTKCRYHVQSVLGNPDGLASVGPTLKPGLWCNAAGGMHGADFCALYAELLADLLDGQSPSRTPVDAWAGRLSPLRYSGT